MTTENNTGKKEFEYMQTQHFKQTYSKKLEYLNNNLTQEQLEKFNSKSFYQKLYYIDVLENKGYFYKRGLL